jgi:hypothetical protein
VAFVEFVGPVWLIYDVHNLIINNSKEIYIYIYIYYGFTFEAKLNIRQVYLCADYIKDIIYIHPTLLVKRD